MIKYLLNTLWSHVRNTIRYEYTLNMYLSSKTHIENKIHVFAV